MKNSIQYLCFCCFFRDTESLWHGLEAQPHVQTSQTGHSNKFFSFVVNQTSSQWLWASQGVRQGGILSTFLYLIFIDDLLLEIQKSSNIGIFNVQSSTPTLADDIFQYSLLQCCKIKCSFLLLKRPQSCWHLSWRLGEECIESSNWYNHLGFL